MSKLFKHKFFPDKKKPNKIIHKNCTNINLQKLNSTARSEIVNEEKKFFLISFFSGSDQKMCSVLFDTENSTKYLLIERFRLILMLEQTIDECDSTATTEMVLWRWEDENGTMMMQKEMEKWIRFNSSSTHSWFVVCNPQKIKKSNELSSNDVERKNEGNKKKKQNREPTNRNSTVSLLLSYEIPQLEFVAIRYDAQCYVCYDINGVYAV